MATVKLYDDNPYEKTFSAKILSLTPYKGKEDKYELILDKTLFFPESGGQSCDRGNVIIDGKNAVVENVLIDKNDNITHIISSSEALAADELADTDVCGTIDWEHRFSNMQQHTAEHIFSGIVHSRYGYRNVGFHLSDNNVTMDYSGYLAPEEVAEIELEVNKIIISNLDVICYYPDEQKLKSLDYRCKGELNGDIRIVEIKGVDICACCCPHVRETGEIGLLKVISSIRYKGGTRLSILCGFRALAYFNLLSGQMSELRALLSAEQSEVAAAVTALKKDRDELKLKLKDANKNRLISDIDRLDETSSALIFTDEADTASMREALNYLISKRNGYCGILSGDDKKGYSYLIGSNSLDSMLVQSELKERFGAKGGGKKEMIQGFVSAAKSGLESLFGSFAN